MTGNHDRIANDTRSSINTAVPSADDAARIRNDDLVICLAQFRTDASSAELNLTHHCTHPLPHAMHYCPCGITWR